MSSWSKPTELNAARFSTHDEAFDTTGAPVTGAAADVALLIAGLATITDGHVGDIYNKNKGYGWPFEPYRL